MRRSALCALALGLAVTSTAHAAKPKPKPKPKPLCNLLQDPKGDGKWVVPAVDSPALDIVGGDISTGAKTMVAVLRLASTDLTPTSDKWTALGFTWSFGVTSSLGQDYVFSASHSASGGASMHWAASVAGASVPLISAKVVGNTFVWVIDRKSSPNLARPKNVFAAIRAHTEVESSSADSANTDASRYPDRALSCVHAD